MSKVEHWENIYTNRSADSVGWYTPHLQTSMKWIAGLNLAAQDAIIDVGGGASTLADDLLASGHKNLSVLDLAESATQVTKDRLGERADSVTWLHGDVTATELPSGHYSLWHDRAVFHFLIEPEMQQKYRDVMLAALKKDGYFIIGAFTTDAPPQCSGLPVQRYTPELLSTVFGDAFQLLRHQYEIHKTPTGFEQAYVYCLFRRTG